MRIGFYGLPCAGKTTILSTLKNIEVLSGSDLLKELKPDFHTCKEWEKEEVRKELAKSLFKIENFIMDGHYAFGKNVVFTEEDGNLYDVFLYRYVNAEEIKKRMMDSKKNIKYVNNDIEAWQLFEMESLREYCHMHNKDFYVVDSQDDFEIKTFIDSILCGFSCVEKAKQIVNSIHEQDEITLIDGDKTYIKEDSTGILGYKTHIFDGNFYTGFQSWKHHRDFYDYLRCIDCMDLSKYSLTRNEKVLNKIKRNQIILTTGYYGMYKQIEKEDSIQVMHGNDICADTKYFVTKFLQEKGNKVIAFGDSMNDYYMLKQADEGYLVKKEDGIISSSLKGKNMEGIYYV